MSLSCSRQHELAEVLRERRWPESCSPELRLHAESCPLCKDLVLVATTLEKARQEAIPMARLASPGLLWWRAQIRQRNAAMERVATPIALVEGLGIAGTVLVAAVLAVSRRQELTEWLSGFAGLSLSGVFGLDGLQALNVSFWTVVIASVATLAVLGGLTAYLVGGSE